MTTAYLCSDDQACIGVTTSAKALAVADALRGLNLFEEAVPSLTSVVVKFDPLELSGEAVLSTLRQIAGQTLTSARSSGKAVEMPLITTPGDAPDLGFAAEHVGLSPDVFYRRLFKEPLEIVMAGFTPGFVYANGPDPEWSVPRLSTPRTWIPAGSVGIAGNRIGIYAMEGPGGWPLIGRTAMTLFDPCKEVTFPLSPGMSIRFVQAS